MTYLMNWQQASAAAAPAATEIVVAAVDVKRGAKLKPEFVKLQSWPNALLPADAILKIEDVVDRSSRTGFVPGEPILTTRIAEGSLGAASLVKPGMRAFTIETPTTASGVGGFIMPGNRVDVLLTMTRDAEAIGGGGTWTLLQNVEILAAGEKLDQGNTEGKASKMQSVTLHVTPEMANKLTLAASMGTLTLTLRNDTDTSIAETSPVTNNELRFLQEALLGEAKEEEDDNSDETEPSSKSAAETVAVTKEPPKSPLEIVALRGTSRSLYQISRNSEASRTAAAP
jgi:pilus assembly protein CpaB